MLLIALALAGEPPAGALRPVPVPSAAEERGPLLIIGNPIRTTATLDLTALGVRHVDDALRLVPGTLVTRHGGVSFSTPPAVYIDGIRRY